MSNSNSTMRLTLQIDEGNLETIQALVQRRLQEATNVSLTISGGGGGGGGGRGGSPGTTSGMAAATASVGRSGPLMGNRIPVMPIAGPPAWSNGYAGGPSGFPSDTGRGPAYNSRANIPTRMNDVAATVNQYNQRMEQDGVVRPGQLGYPDQSGPPVTAGMLYGMTAAQRAYAGQFARGGLFVGGQTLAGYASAETNTILSGRPDPQAYASVFGAGIGGLIGAGVGSFFPGFGSIIGAGVGMSAGGQAAAWAMAPFTAGMKREQSLMYGTSLNMDMSGRTAGTTLNAHPLLNRLTPLRQWTEGAESSIRDKWFAGQSEYAATADDYAGMYAAGVRAFSAAGWNPEQPSGYFTDIVDHYGKKRSRRQATGPDGKPLTRREWHDDGVSQTMKTTVLPDTPDSTYTIPGTAGRPGTPGKAARYDAGDDTDIQPLVDFTGRQKQLGRRLLGVTPEGTFTPAQKGTPGTPGTADKTVRVPGAKGGKTTETSTTRSGHWADEPVYESFDEDDKSKPYYKRVQAGLLQTHIANIATRFGSAAPEASKLYNAIVGSYNETGGNMTDIGMRYGAEGAKTWHTALHGMQAYDPWYDKMQPVMQSAQRLMAFDTTKVRGAAQAGHDTLTHLMMDVYKMPQGPQSLTYAQLGAQRRTMQIAAYGEKDTVDFDIPGVKLAGERSRMELLTFSPGNIYKNSLQTMQHSMKYQKRLTGEMESLRKAGDLSEAAELSYTQRIEALKTQNAMSLATLSMGAEDRLPGMMAGAPSFFSRYTSQSLAAANMGRAGAPWVRAYGAANGSQLHDQDAFVSGYAVPSVAPYSRTENLNSPQIISLLQRLVNAAEAQNRGSAKSSNSLRPGEQVGSVTGGVSRSFGTNAQGLDTGGIN